MKIIYLNLGPSFEQLKLSTKSLRNWNPQAEIVLYSDQIPEEILEKDGINIDEIRKWNAGHTGSRAVFGTEAFARLTLHKSAVILDALKTYKEAILFVDTDVIFADAISAELQKCFSLRPLWISTDSHWGINRTPSLGVCTGILAMRPESQVIHFMEMWHEHHKELIENGQFLHDQEAFNLIYADNEELYKLTGIFPVTFAMPGWMYPSVVPFNPFKNGVAFPPLFHCNFVTHNEDKIERMQHIVKATRRPKNWSSFLADFSSHIFGFWKNHRPPYRSIMSRN